MKKILTLEETAKMMLSKDYKERFRAEYYQLVNRYKRLKLMLEKWDNGTLGFTPDCTRGIYETQLEIMEKYIAMLEIRAYFEKIDLLDGGSEGLVYTTESMDVLRNAVVGGISAMINFMLEAKKEK